MPRSSVAFLDVSNWSASGTLSRVENEQEHTASDVDLRAPPPPHHRPAMTASTRLNTKCFYR